MKWLRNKLKGNKGFSFIEVVLTTLVLSIGLMGGLVLMDNSSRNSGESRARETASQLAHEKLEMITADKTFSGYTAITNTLYPSENLSGAFEGYTRTTNIYEVDRNDLGTYSVGSGFKRIDVYVSWGSESYQNITVSTILTDR